MKKLLVIGLILLFSFAFAQDAVAPKTVPVATYNALAEQYKKLEQQADSYMKRMVQAQDANTELRQIFGNFASDLMALHIAKVDSVLKTYGIERR